MVWFLGCPAQDQESDSMILMAPLQLRILYDSVIFFTNSDRRETIFSFFFALLCPRFPQLFLCSCISAEILEENVWRTTGGGQGMSKSCIYLVPRFSPSLLWDLHDWQSTGWCWEEVVNSHFDGRWLERGPPSLLPCHPGGLHLPSSHAGVQARWVAHLP